MKSDLQPGKTNETIAFDYRALIFTTSTGAFAMHCPLDMKKIDVVLAQGSSLSVDDLARANALRVAGEAMCIHGVE